MALAPLAVAYCENMSLGKWVSVFCAEAVAAARHINAATAVEIMLRIIGSTPELALQTQIAGNLAGKNVAKPLPFAIRRAGMLSDSKNGPVFVHS